MNSRLDTVQAVVLRAKLARLDDWNAMRVAAADRYSQLLADTDAVITPTALDGNEHVWHLYVVRVPDRDRVLGVLNDAGIGSGIHYPSPIHRHPAFEELDVEVRSASVAEKLAGEILTCPSTPGSPRNSNSAWWTPSSTPCSRSHRAAAGSTGWPSCW